MQRRVEPQAQAQQSPSVSEQTGQGAGVHADPLCLVAPAPSFLHTPEEIDAYQLEACIQEESQGEEEQGDDEVRMQAGLEDLLGPAEAFCHQDTWEEKFVILFLKFDVNYFTSVSHVTLLLKTF